MANLVPKGKDIAIKKDQSLVAANMIKEKAPIIIEKAFAYLEKYHDDEDPLRRREAHTIQNIILNKMMPTLVQHKVEHENTIDDNVADFMIRLATSKGIDLSDKNIKDVEYEVN